MLTFPVRILSFAEILERIFRYVKVSTHRSCTLVCQKYYPTKENCFLYGVSRQKQARNSTGGANQRLFFILRTFNLDD